MGTQRMINAAVLHGIGQVPRYEPFPAPVATLREQGFSDIAEGTVYALLVRIEQRGLVEVEKIPSEKGPPRKVYSLNAQGRESLEEFWRTWSFLAERLEQLREGGR
jgi:PadR family transcriptional regulator PadR